MFWLIFFIVLWGIIHSILASTGFKDLLRRSLGNGFMKFYRLLYNIFAVVSLAPVLYLMISLPDKTLYQVPAPWSYLMWAAQAISALLFSSPFCRRMCFLVGVRQLVEGRKK
jgi:hypothetical protein